MRTDRHPPSGRWSAVLAALLTTGPVVAEIRQFGATVESEVVEFTPAGSGDLDFAFERFPGVSTSNLPMTAQARVVGRDAADQPIAEGRATTTFTDPRLSQTPSPEEFGISAAAVTLDASNFFRSRSAATESRTIVFTPSEVGLSDGTPIRVRSQFFLDGLLVLWSRQVGGTLDDAYGRVRVEVAASAADGSGRSTVLSAEIALSGTADGTAELTTGGAVTNDNLVSLDLSGLVEPFGAIQATFIPYIAIPYEYDAVVGEPIILDALIEGTAVNRPNGCGAAVILGVEPDDLASLVNEVTGTNAGDLLAQTLTNARATAPAPEEPLPAAEGDEITPRDQTDVRSLWPLCGGLGIESLVGTLLAGALFSARRR